MASAISETAEDLPSSERALALSHPRFSFEMLALLPVALSAFMLPIVDWKDSLLFMEEPPNEAFEAEPAALPPLKVLEPTLSELAVIFGEVPDP